MQTRLSERIKWPLALILVLAAMAVVVAGCGGGDSSSSGSTAGTEAESETEAESTEAAETEGSGEAPDTSSVTEERLEQTITDAYNKAIPVSELNPIAVEGLKIASLPITPQLESELEECMAKPVCETGHGEKTIGIAEDYSAEIPYRVQLRAVITLQALRYPSVGKIIYTEAGGELPKLLSNFRSLVSQGANVIIGTWAEGDALIPVAKEATSKGVAVVPVTQEIPGAVAGTNVAGQVLANLCSAGEERAELAIEAAGGGSSGTVQLMTGPPGNTFAATWMPCAEKVLKAKGWSYAESNTEWTPQGEQQTASALIASSNPPNAIIYDYTAEAVVGQYLKENAEPPPLIAGAGSAAYMESVIEAKKKFPKFEGYTATSGLSSFAVGVTLGLDAADGKQVAEVETPEPTEAVESPAIQAQLSAELPATSSLNSLMPAALVKKVMGG